MKKLSAALRRLRLLASAAELSRIALLAVAIVSLLWLGIALLGRSEALTSPTAMINNDYSQGFLRILLEEMRIRNLIDLGNDPVVVYDPVSSNEDLAWPDGSADFVFSASSDGFDRINRILKDGGFAAFPLSPKLQPPANYKTVYIGQIGVVTIIAMQKYATTAAGRRRLLDSPQKKMEALMGLEDVLLEPPRRQLPSRQPWKKNKYLPELTGDSLDGYPLRVFMEVVPRGDAPGSAAAWFDKHYPKQDRPFEVMQLVVVEEGESNSATSTATAASTPTALSQLSSPAEWLERNVKEEDYVVLKAEAEVVEEMLAKGSVRLVDELFLQCRHQWGKKRERGRRAYWECLSLYGKLRDEGIAVHQWWDS